MAFEENDISINAHGGTELAKRKLGKILDPKLLENFQIICSRVRELEEDKIRIFWAHDLPEDPESSKFRDKNFLSAMHKFVFISNWQQSRYQLFHGLPYDDKSVTLEHGIETVSFDDIPSGKFNDEKIRIVYSSTPNRGLSILVPAFLKFVELHPEIDVELDVFSSFAIYGWAQRDEEFKELFDVCKNHPKINYHGFVENDVLRKHLTKSHIWAYPSMWMETSCRAMLEAMSACMLCIHPNYGALPDTSGSLNVMYQGNQDPEKHLEMFYFILERSILQIKHDPGLLVPRIGYNKVYIDQRYDINAIAQSWTYLLESLVEQYPTVESRKIVKPVSTFSYRA